MRFSPQSSRFPNWNYSNSGIYFITICTLNKNIFFGKIVDDKMELSKMGLIAQNCLNEIPTHFPDVCFDASIVMPNHVHILFHVETPDLASINKKSINNILKFNAIQTPNNQNNNEDRIISNSNIVVLNETPDLASLQVSRKIKLINYSHNNHPDFYTRISQKSKQLIPKIIQQYKSTVTRQINTKTVFFSWQSRYHDIIIKDEKQFYTVKNYIINNTNNWQKDKFHI